MLGWLGCFVNAAGIISNVLVCCIITLDRFTILSVIRLFELHFNRLRYLILHSQSVWDRVAITPEFCIMHLYFKVKHIEISVIQESWKTCKENNHLSGSKVERQQAIRFRILPSFNQNTRKHTHKHSHMYRHTHKYSHTNTRTDTH